MIWRLHIVEASARQIRDAAEHTLEDYRAGLITQEPHFTDRMLGGIREAMNGFEIRGVTWRATTLGDRGPGSPESRYGADFVGILEIDLPDFQVR